MYSTISKLKNYLTQPQPFLVLLLTNGIANFSRAREFGFYDDDWGMLARHWGLTLKQGLRVLASDVLSFRLGRPIQFVFNNLLGILGGQSHSILLMYVTCFILTTLSAWFFFKALRHKFPANFSLVASSIYLISPLTTLRAYLNANSYKPIGIIILFLSISLFLNHKKTSYFLSFLLPFVQESLFFIFLTAPLFHFPIAKLKSIKSWGRHLITCTFLLFVYLAIRHFVGENRISEAQQLHTVGSIKAMVSMPFTYSFNSFTSYYYPLVVIFNYGNPIYFAAGIIFGLLYCFYTWTIMNKKISQEVLFESVTLGALLLICGYSLIYFERGEFNLGFPLSGRPTRFSTFSTFGSSILITSLIFLLKNKIWRHGLSFVVICVLSSYSFFVQNDYSLAWKFTREVFEQIIRQTPDYNENTPIIIAADELYPVPSVKSLRIGSVGFEQFGYELILPLAHEEAYFSRLLFMDKDWPQLFTKVTSDEVFWNPVKVEKYRFELMYKSGYWKKNSFIVFDIDVKTSKLKRNFKPRYVEGLQVVKVDMRSRTKSFQHWQKIMDESYLKDLLKIPPNIYGK